MKTADKPISELTVLDHAAIAFGAAYAFQWGVSAEEAADIAIEYAETLCAKLDKLEIKRGK